MLDWIKKRGIGAWCVFAAAVLGLIAFIIYIVNSTTGYMAGSPVSGMVIAFTLIAVLLLGGALALSDKINSKFIDLALFVAAVLLLVSFVVFVLARINLFADVYFIPVNFPQGEADSLNVSIVGFVFYFLSVAAIIAGTFFGKMSKDA